MGFVSEDAGIAASVYLAVFVLYIALDIYIISKKGWRTMYTSLLIYGIMRLAGQICGTAFASLGLRHWQWLVAYLVFSAEGYFALILTTFHFLINNQIRVFGKSWLETSGPRLTNTKKSNNWFTRNYTWARIFHFYLIPANVMIIVGGSMLTGIEDSSYSDIQHKINTSKGLRTTGQAIFLMETILTILLILWVYFKENVRTTSMKMLFFISPFILLRGIFGILSIYIDKMNYYDFSNYNKHGLDLEFVAYEYCLGTTAEFIAGLTLILTYYIDDFTVVRARNDEESATEPLTIQSDKL